MIVTVGYDMIMAVWKIAPYPNPNPNVGGFAGHNLTLGNFTGGIFRS